jgi:hypothetical protein
MDQQRMNTVSISADETDPREPSSRCDRCAKVGTIARARRHSEPPLVLRYCAECWPTAEGELEMLQQEEQDRWRRSIRGRSSAGEKVTPPAPWTTTSRSWHDVLRFLDLIRQPPKGGRAPTSEDLASIASEIRATASEMAGDMPPAVADFIGRNSPPAA